MKVLMVLVMVAVLFPAADAAYALGGGGRHGDGRSDSLPNAVVVSAILATLILKMHKTGAVRETLAMEASLL
jgi:hypothetical protein